MHPDAMAEVTTSASAARTTGAPRAVAVLLAVLALLAGALVLYRTGLAAAYEAWSRPEYSYGYIVPFIAAYLLWRRLPDALLIPPSRRWVGVALAAVAVLLGLVGAASRIADLSGYGFILLLAAGAIALLGLPAALRLWAPIAYLGFMLPLPQIIYLKLSAAMQLVSSELGVALVRLIGVPVLLEGNIIDLGTYKLQVAEACSGLRYLFPLMGFGFLFAMLYRGPQWQRWTLFLSTIPITIGMNSLRIAVIGVLVTYFGIAQAEGFLHFFEGWIIFLGCIALLFAETALLARLVRTRTADGRRAGLRDRLDLELGRVPQVARIAANRGWVRPLSATLGLLIAGLLVLSASQAGDSYAVPPRSDLVRFPVHVGSLRGEQTALPAEQARVLAADDYLMATYVPAAAAELAAINLFVAYYANQTDGRAVHSPMVCLPGDGWEVQSFASTVVHPSSAPEGMHINRAVIQKGISRALVYYWFEGRGRKVSNEYVAKWFILWDGITRNRTDGAIIRIVTPLPDGADEAAADERLLRFIDGINPALPAFIPA